MTLSVLRQNLAWDDLAMLFALTQLLHQSEMVTNKIYHNFLTTFPTSDLTLAQKESIFVISKSFSSLKTNLS